MYKLHSACRACGLGYPEMSTLKQSVASGPQPPAQSLISVFDLGVQPLANDFANGTEEHAGFAPLKVLFCPRCSLGQLSVVVNPSILYRNYSYVTSTSETMKKHFSTLVNDLESAFGTGSVIEIGSNDGTLLGHIRKEWNVPVLGIEPAENLSRIANNNGVPTLTGFLSKETAKTALSAIGRPRIIIARHVFCHIDDWHSALDSIESMCGKDTGVCIEVPYSADLLRENQWDTIYHEHLSYLSLNSIEWALKRTNLHMHWLHRYPIHGGSVAIFLRHNDSVVKTSPDMKEDISEQSWRTMAQRAEINAMELSSKVRELVEQGKRVVGYGASAKSTVWINACGFDQKDISFICDSTHQKRYKYSPGTSIPIVDEGALTRELPDYAICFAWNFSTEIIAKEALFRKHGGKWIVPVPNIQIV